MITEPMLMTAVKTGLVLPKEATTLWAMPEWLFGRLGNKWIELLFDSIDKKMADNPALIWLGTMLQEGLLEYLED